MFNRFDIGITAVSISGALIKEIVTLLTKGGSGAVIILNLIFPDSFVSSPRISNAVLIRVLKRIETPGALEVCGL